MTNQHPTTPPPELVHQWETTAYDDRSIPYAHHIARCAAQWGWWRREPEIQAAADQELEACCEWLDREGWSGESRQLRAARRPKPPSLKEQALEELNKVDMLWDTTEFSQETLNSLDTIRRALEQLDD
jgi:hypothetical protein